eukprot:COSAG01_NODE_3_length_63519_cov_1591.007663_7_plen_392_part_00
MKNYLFTSESVSEGHPDKVCDQISDAILDAALKEDPQSRVAAETMICPKGVIVSGEITSKKTLDIEKIAKNQLKKIGYTKENGFDTDNCAVFNYLEKQSPDIAQGVNKAEGLHKKQGAGDQGIMFGYACKQTKESMPLPISLSHHLVKKLTDLRHNNILDFLRPDSKSQVTIEYENNQAKRIDTVVLSTQHNPDISHKELEEAIIETLIKKELPQNLLDKNTIYHVNPTGRFVLGGPAADAGLTGRKIIVDTYGGWARHGGGAFSGKDPSKVDRSAAYMARYIAKNIVNADIVEELEIQLSYAIGVPEPVGIFIQTPKLNATEKAQLITLIKNNFDLSPEGIISTLNLKRDIYTQTAAYGHFGRQDIQLPWEESNKASILKNEWANLHIPA